MSEEPSTHPSPSRFRSETPGSSQNALDARHFDRLRWHCRRGLLELDLVLLSFLEKQYPNLSPSERLAFDKLLATPDELLLRYVQGDQIPPEIELKQIVEKIRK